MISCVAVFWGLALPRSPPWRALILITSRLVRNHAACGAILTVAVADGRPVSIGSSTRYRAATALVFTQVLFSPDPVALTVGPRRNLTTMG